MGATSIVPRPEAHVVSEVEEPSCGSFSLGKAPFDMKACFGMSGLNGFPRSEIERFCEKKPRNRAPCPHDACRACTIVRAKCPPV